MINDDNLNFIMQWIKSEIGLILDEKKRYLVEHRLGRLIEKKGFDTIDDLLNAFRNDPQAEKYKQDIIDALVTNETSFFRDKRPFLDFKSIIKKKATEKPGRVFNIWSAASSTGQEAYSMAIILEELRETGLDFEYRILATDVSHTALELARKGTYNHFEIQRGLQIQQIIKWFTQEENVWTIKPNLRNHIRFEYFNLLAGDWPFKDFDMVFLRNVLIYFDRDEKIRVIQKIAQILDDKALVFLGGTETLHYTTDLLEPVRDYESTLYRKNNGAEVMVDVPSSMISIKNLRWPYQDGGKS